MATVDQVVNGVVAQSPESAAQHYVANKEFKTIGKGLVKDGASKIPFLAPAFIANDVINGALQSQQLLGLDRGTTLPEKFAEAAAKAANGFSWGVVPTDESAKRLARMLTGGVYNTPNIQYDPSQAYIQKLITR